MRSQAVPSPGVIRVDSPVPVDSRPEIDGKFLSVDGERFFVKGATYGAFPPNSAGDQFPEMPELKRDFELMGQAGINSILTYTVPPISLLDQAAEQGLRVIVNIPWQGHVCFLEERSYRRQVRREVAAAVESCRQHPAVLMHCVAKELPPQIIRWHGPERTSRFLKQLCDVAKDKDPEALVSYTNFPTTEYLDLSFVDVFTFNVYLHSRREFSSYLARLQHLSGEQPFVLTELGMCSLRHGEDGQADFIDWQLEEAFSQGAAGAMIFGWTDPFFQDGMLIDEWGFGLVDAERKPKPSYEVAKRRFETQTPFDPERDWPSVSVVVALHNAGRTLDSCLAALAQMNYPNYEVVVVNDGSTDNSREIIEKYPQFKAIHQQQEGVSGGRNSGWQAASGEIVAYIDSDADADPDWLFYIADTFMTQDVAGTGGPNFVPAEDGWIAKCVYRSPGGPTQVMFNDRLAEHVPGCNMAFRRSAIEAIGGFDPLFRTAGDDVDFCWRLLEAGLDIGFSPSAVVWHHRRSSIRAYWKQQVGYGKAEALLETRHPNKFNPWGHTFWAGNIYAPYPVFRVFGRPVIYQGLWGTAGFQSMYDRGAVTPLASLPRSMEFHMALIVLTIVGFFFPWAFALVALGLAYAGFYALYSAFKADLRIIEETEPDAGRLTRLKWRLTTALLHLIEPIARDWGRIRGGLTPWRSVPRNQRDGSKVSRWWQRFLPLRRTVGWAFPGGMGQERTELLTALSQTLLSRRAAVGWNSDVDAWDLKVRRGALGEAKLRLVVEHHGGPKRLTRLSAEIMPRPVVRRGMIAAAAAMAVAAVAQLTIPAMIFAVCFLVLWLLPIVEASRLERTLSGALLQVLGELDPQGDTA